MDELKSIWDSLNDTVFAVDFSSPNGVTQRKVQGIGNSDVTLQGTGPP